MLRICQLVGWQIVKIDHFSDEHQREADYQVGRHLLSELLQLWSLILSRVLKIDLMPVSLCLSFSRQRRIYKRKIITQNLFCLHKLSNISPGGWWMMNDCSVWWPGCIVSVSHGQDSEADWTDWLSKPTKNHKMQIAPCLQNITKCLNCDPRHIFRGKILKLKPQNILKQTFLA